ncbi:MAG: hypothetical protein IJQ81_05680 [Oscillibacter sp.]|nr:hypothetical protein [Oscillibacter sp.]
MRRSVKIRVLSIAYCFLILCCLSACAIGGRNRGGTDGGFADNQVSESEHDGTNELTETESDGESLVSDPSQETEEETAAEAEKSRQLSSVEDIGLHAVDETGKNYAFSYHQEEFSARYTPDNWKIVDSYKITDMDDIVVICQALSDVHPVHGRDMESFRAPEDMAFEWLQHNIAYAVLPDNSPWKRNAKDVDLNPADQGKTFEEMYEDRTGKKFRIEDFLRFD